MKSYGYSACPDCRFVMRQEGAQLADLCPMEVEFCAEHHAWRERLLHGDRFGWKSDGYHHTNGKIY